MSKFDSPHERGANGTRSPPLLSTMMKHIKQVLQDNPGNFRSVSTQRAKFCDQVLEKEGALE